MGKLGKMASGQNEKWAKMKLGKTAKGQDRYWGDGKRAKLERAKKEWAKREKFRRNGNGQNWIGGTGNKPFPTLIKVLLAL